jgi:hypothetical protein
MFRAMSKQGFYLDEEDKQKNKNNKNIADFELETCMKSQHPTP